MKILSGNVKKIYLNYLFLALGSAMISSIYSLVDMAIVGKYYGPEGTASLVVVAPIWNIIYSLGLLTGIGGATLFSLKSANNNQENKNEYFTVSLLFSLLLIIIVSIGLFYFEDQLLIFFGANSDLIKLSKTYLLPIKFTIPFFLLNQMLTAFLRIDNNPSLATISVLSGGIINIIGDYFFVFTLDMGILGAGIATSLGALISILITLTHFFSKKNTIKLVIPTKIFKKAYLIFITGFSTFFVDIAMGILTIIFNRQISKYLGNDHLSVYGIIVNISTFVQCLAYGVGQASQPLFTTYYGTKKIKLINKTLKYAINSVILIGLIWTISCIISPNFFVYLFMKPTNNVLEIAPKIIRIYSLSFLLLSFNIFSTYYFQSLIKPKIAFIISFLRGCLISGLFILIFPILFGVDSIWWSMLISELLVGIFTIFNLIISQNKMNNIQFIY